MDINSVMSNYNNYNTMNSLLNPDSAKVPLVSSVSAEAKEKSEEMTVNKISPETELQNIFNNIQANSGLAANINMSNNVDSLTLLYGGTSPITAKTLDVYNSIQNGTFKPSTTSIVTSSPYTLYSNVNSMMNQLQSTGTLFNATA